LITRFGNRHAEAKFSVSGVWELSVKHTLQQMADYGNMHKTLLCTSALHSLLLHQPRAACSKLRKRGLTCGAITAIAHFSFLNLHSAVPHFTHSHKIHLTVTI